MEALGIHTGMDLRRQSMRFLEEHFGKSKSYLYGVARGSDDRPVAADRVRKSVGAENRFERDVTDWNEALDLLQPILAKAWDHSIQGGRVGRTVTLKVKYADFRKISRSRSNPAPIAARAELQQ